MIPTANIVVVDDREEDLSAIVSSLWKMNAACLPIHVVGGIPNISRPLKGVQIVFFDILYTPTVPSGAAAYDSAADVLRRVIADDNGPYVLITWSTVSIDHDEFMTRLSDVHTDVPPPAASAALSKAKFSAGAKTGEKKLDELRRDIQKVVAKCSQVDALFVWQESAQEAARSVCGSILNMVDRNERFTGGAGASLERLLRAIVREAVGKTNVERDRLRALNEGLGPILLDRLTHTSASNSSSKKILRAAIPDPKPTPKLSGPEITSLNNMHSFSFTNPSGVSLGERGAVCTLPDALKGNGFWTFSGMRQHEAFKYFVVAKGTGTTPNWNVLKKNFEWVLVGLTAPCDEAQAKATHLRRVALALEIPDPIPSKFKRVAENSPATADTPAYFFDGMQRKLVFNWLFVSSVAQGKWIGSIVRFRIRDPLMSDLGTKFTAHAARLGHIAF